MRLLPNQTHPVSLLGSDLYYPEVGSALMMKTLTYGITTAVFVTVSVNVQLEDIMSDASSGSYLAGSESEAERRPSRKVFRLSYTYIPEYRERFNGYPWKILRHMPLVPSPFLQNSKSLSISDSSYDEDIEQPIRNQKQKKIKQKKDVGKLAKSYVIITNTTESSESLESLSLQSL